MRDSDKTTLKVAILDLYDGHPNQGMRCFQEILDKYKVQNQLELSYQVFDIRGKNETPGTDSDIYIFSGGPGSPLESEGSPWENSYFTLINKIQEHNDSDRLQKKYALFVCHSFQLMCRHYGLGTVNKRHSTSFGILPIHQTAAGLHDVVFTGLPEPFYSVDSRDWQVIQPNHKRFAESGATLLAIEKERPNVDLERCMMAIRFNEFFFGTQFHPEADPAGMRLRLMEPLKKEQTIAEHGEQKYYEMLDRLDDPDKIMLTQNTLIPNFLNQAILTFQEI